MDRIETRALYLNAYIFLIIAIICVIGFVYDVSFIFVKYQFDLEGLLQMLLITSPFDALIIVSVLGSFPKLSIDNESILVNSTYIKHIYSLEDISIDPKSHILKRTPPFRQSPISKYMFVNGLFVPFKEDVFMHLKEKVKTSQSSFPVCFLSLIPIPIFILLYEISKNFAAPLIVWAFVIGVTNSLSFSTFVYTLPGKTLVGNLGRGKSAVTIGISIGLITSLIWAVTTIL